MTSPPLDDDAPVDDGAPVEGRAPTRSGWFRRLVRPGQVLPALARWLLRLAASRATWVFLAGGAAGVLVASYLTGPLPHLPTGGGGGVNLQFYAGTDSGNPGRGGARHNALAAWNSSQKDGLRAIYHDIGSSSDQQRNNLQIALGPKSPTHVDVVVLDTPDVPLFAHLNQLSSLGGIDTTGMLDEPLKACAYEGKQWALPLNADAPMLAYNIPLLSQGLGLNDQAVRQRYNSLEGWKLYDTMLADGQRTIQVLGPTRPGLTGIYAGQFADYEGFTVNIVEELDAQGANLYRDPYLREDASRSAVAEVTKRLMEPNFLPPGSLSSPVTAASGYQEGQSNTALRDGKVLFARMWPSDFKELNDAARGKFGEVTLTDGVLGGQCVAVAAKSHHQREARALVRFLTGDMTQYQLLMDGGYAPIREVVYGEKSARDEYTYLPTLLTAIKSATPRVRLPYYFRYSQQLRKEIVRAMANGYQLDDDAPGRLRAASKGRAPETWSGQASSGQ